MTINYPEEVISADEDSYFGIVIDAYEYYLKEYDEYEKLFLIEQIKGQKLTDLSENIPGWTILINSIWADINAITSHLETRIEKEVHVSRKMYNENYNRQLTAQDLKNYSENSDNVIAIKELLIRFVNIKEKWEGISRGLERLHYQVRNIMELRKAGLDELCY